MIFFGILIVLLFVVIITFASPKLSPIPYFPTNWDDLPQITAAFPLADGITVIDLGAGTGTVIFALADEAIREKKRVELAAVEINPFLVSILLWKKITHPYRKHIHVFWKDIFTTPYEKFVLPKTTGVIVYLYVSPRLLKKISGKIDADLGKKTPIVSYMYSIPDKTPRKTITTGNHPIYIYN